MGSNQKKVKRVKNRLTQMKKNKIRIVGSSLESLGTDGANMRGLK